MIKTQYLVLWFIAGGLFVSTMSFATEFFVPAGDDLLSATSIVIDVTTANLPARITAIRGEIVHRSGEANDIGPKIEQLLDCTMVTVDGITVQRKGLARDELLSTGQSALPALMDATEDPNPRIRAQVLPLIYHLSARKMAGLDMLPVYLRARMDKNEDVRKSAICAIGNIAVTLSRAKKDEERDILANLLVEHLKDRNEGVQYLAGSYLFRCDRKDLVPEAIVKKHRLGEEQI